MVVFKNFEIENCKDSLKSCCNQLDFEQSIFSIFKNIFSQSNSGISSLLGKRKIDTMSRAIKINIELIKSLLIFIFKKIEDKTTKIKRNIFTSCVNKLKPIKIESKNIFLISIFL